jgi:thiol-disulfide isomerase/thioredoxin
MKLSALTIFALLLLTGSLTAQTTAAPKQSKTAAAAKTAPADTVPAELQLNDVAGKSHSLADYRGKFVVLNFWATWCAPCQDEMPLLVKANKKFADRGLVVIAASIDESDTLRYVPKFVQNENMDFPVWVGARLADMEKLGVGPGMPSTAFIDKDGRITSRVIGQLKKNDLEARIEWMLGSRTGTPPQAVADNMKKSK